MRKEYKKLLRNTGMLAIGSFASSLLSMLLVPFYTAVLSPEDYGISDLITTTTALLYPFMTLAISESIMRFTLDEGTEKKSIYSIGLSLLLTGFLLVLGLSSLIQKTSIGHYTIYFLCYYLFFGLHTISSYFVKGLENVRIYSIAGLINSAVVILCNLLFLLVFNWGLVGYLMAAIVGHAVTTCFLFWGAKLYHFLIVPWKIDRTLLKNMLRYSIPVIPNSVSWWVANSSDKYMLNYYADTAQVGIYSVSYKIPSIMMTIMGFFIGAWQLSAVENFGSEESRDFFSDVYEKCFECNILIAMGIIILAKPAGAFLYSDDFFLAWRFVPVLVIANICNVMSSFLGTVYTSAKKTKMLSVSTMIGATTNVLMNLLLIPLFGAMGAAIATALSYFVIWIMRLENSRKIMSFPIAYNKQSIQLLLVVVEAVLICADTILTTIFATIVFALFLASNRQLLIFLLKQIYERIPIKR